MLGILIVLNELLLDDAAILFDVVVVHSVVHLKTLQFPKW